MEILPGYLALMRPRAVTWARQSRHHWAPLKLRAGLPRRLARAGGFGVGDSSTTMGGAGVPTRASSTSR